MRKVRSSTTHIARLDALTADPQNANLGTERGREALAQSLREFGPGRAVLIDRHGNIIAGNKTVEEAKRLNIPLQVVKTDGNVLVAVQREDLDLTTDVRAKRLAIADNRVGQLDLEWDVDMLKRLQGDGMDLSAFWTVEEFATLFAESTPGLTDENSVVEPAATDIVRGDLFALGAHRLLCGDATSAAAVARLLDGATPNLMATDPPYGVKYDAAWRHRVNPTQRTAVGRVMNDDRAEWKAAWQLFPGAIAYVWHAGLKASTVAADLEAAGFAIRSQIIWQKQHFALSRGDYHWGHEPAWYAVRGKGRWVGDRRQTTVWEVPNLNAMGGARTADNAVTGHSTQKPVRLFEVPILNHTVAGDAVYDPFVGSGTMVIAAQKTGRTAFAMELDPRYVQAAITRWEQFTAQRAKRLGRPTAREALVTAGRRGKGRGGKGGHEPRTRLRLREAQVLEHVLEGRTQHQIAGALGISQPAVSKIARRVEERLLADLAYRVERQRARQTLRLEHIYSQAMQAWQDSKQEGLRRRQRKTEQASGTGSTVAELISENRHGDPRYLDEARKALGDLRKVWGVDAPERVSIDAVSHFASMSDDALDVELARHLRFVQPLSPAVDVPPALPLIAGGHHEEKE